MDTVKAIQVGDDPPEFVTLETFVEAGDLRKVSFDEAKRKGAYTVFVMNDETVMKAFVTGTSKHDVIRAMISNRSERRFDVVRWQVKAIYQRG